MVPCGQHERCQRILLAATVAPCKTQHNNCAARERRADFSLYDLCPRGHLSELSTSCSQQVVYFCGHARRLEQLGNAVTETRAGRRAHCKVSRGIHSRKVHRAASVVQGGSLGTGAHCVCVQPMRPVPAPACRDVAGTSHWKLTRGKGRASVQSHGTGVDRSGR